MKRTLLSLFKSHYIICSIILLIILSTCYYIYTNENQMKKIETLVKEIDSSKYYYSPSTPERKTKKTESECRRIIENLFQVPFPCIRPNFLKNPETGKNLEIDMFNEQLRLGFEYQGIQHRKFCPFFHKKYEDFIEQIRRDKYKKKVCDKIGITLIYIPDTVKFDNLQEFIKMELKKYNMYD